MITAGGGDDQGRKLLLLGLTEKNLQRLRNGEPIDVPRAGLEKAGLAELRVIVVYGETNDDIFRQVVSLQTT